MSILEAFEEVDLNELPIKHKQIPFTGSRHKKFLSETLSTYSHTLEFEFPSCQNISSKIEDKNSNFSKKKSTKKQAFELSERLNSLKQITENKIKFMKVEKELKELEECTFKPKTNMIGIKSSVQHFSKQQVEYVKAKNTGLLKLKFRVQMLQSHNNLRLATNKSLEVHERLYKDSKMLARPKKIN